MSDGSPISCSDLVCSSMSRLLLGSPTITTATSLTEGALYLPWCSPLGTRSALITTLYSSELEDRVSSADLKLYIAVVLVKSGLQPSYQHQIKIAKVRVPHISLLSSVSYEVDLKEGRHRVRIRWQKRAYKVVHLSLYLKRRHEASFRHLISTE